MLVRDNGLADDDLNEIRRKSLGVSMRDASAVAQTVPGVELTVPCVGGRRLQDHGAGGAYRGHGGWASRTTMRSSPICELARDASSTFSTVSVTRRFV